jgi:dTDP-4-dehydrorhamnose 3,5-epimerase-like enzyme
MPEEPKLIKGGLAVDDRGEVAFVNDFSFDSVKRFYMLANHSEGFVRAWHGHKKESKYFHVVNGSALICAVKIDNWASPSSGLEIFRFTLSEKAPSMLYIPAGFANGSMSLTNDCKIMVFSTSTLEESLNDDFRFPARLWDPWKVEER